MRNLQKYFRGRTTRFLAAAMLVALALVAYGFYLQDAFLQVSAATLSLTGVWGSLPGDSGGHGIMFGDVDDDGNPDMYVTFNQNHGAEPDLFFSNQGGWVFEEESEERGIDDSNDGGSHGAAWADLDNDGDFDLLNGATLPPGFGGDDTDRGENNDVYRNNGNGSFTRVTPAAFLNNNNRTRAILALDWDNDGDLDVFSIEGSDEDTSPEAYRNNGNFQFTEITSGALVNSTGHQGATDTDYDGDGDV
ncbi:MAG TPA: VCBS repeat-containing protein, partial [Dehalococcoidia bacterium]|nr:VCBS repeat-containing protein [Dehalococcoidia bacterium]